MSFSCSFYHITVDEEYCRKCVQYSQCTERDRLDAQQQADAEEATGKTMKKMFYYHANEER